MSALERLAKEKGLDEIAKVFAEASRVRQAEVSREAERENLSIQERRFQAAVRRVLRNPSEYSNEYLEIARVLARPLADIDRVLENAGSRRQIVRLAQTGVPIMDIASAFDLDPRDIARVVDEESGPELPGDQLTEDEQEELMHTIAEHIFDAMPELSEDHPPIEGEWLGGQYNDLPLIERTILSLSLGKKMSIDRVAETLHVDPGNVAKIQQKALQHLLLSYRLELARQAAQKTMKVYGPRYSE